MENGFVISSTIKGTNQIFFHGLSINENEQNRIGLKLSLWKSRDPDFENPNLRITVGGVYQRSYSPFSIYQLMNLRNGKSYYFAMENPLALHGLENQYENILSHLNFSHFDLSKQGSIFSEKVQDKILNENVIVLPLDNCHTSIHSHSIQHIQQAQIWFEMLWDNLFLSMEEF